MRLTTAKYYTPSHKVIHKQDITPNIVVTMTDEKEAAVLSEWLAQFIDMRGWAPSGGGQWPKSEHGIYIDPEGNVWSFGTYAPGP